MWYEILFNVVFLIVFPIGAAVYFIRWLSKRG
jgi:hypothetical protein